MIDNRVQLICSIFLAGMLDVDGHRFEWDEAIKTVPSSSRGLMNFALIVPGTKWCGHGNVAENDDELGSHRETDSCCRSHDKCPELMKSGSSKYGLTNNAPYTRTDCICDGEFLKCLRNARHDWLAEVVGLMYFGFFRQKCYKLEHQVIGCTEYNSLAERCEKYIVDPESPQSWQWFDVPFFNSRKTMETAIEFRQ